MKKLFLLTMASVMTICAMAKGTNDGSTKANAKEFDWDKGITHDGGTLWYRVDLAPLYDEENPSLTLYLTNPSNDVGTSVDVSMQANVAGQSESKDYTISARQYKTYTANAKMLVTLKQTEIYLTLTSNGRIKLSAKVFEAADLDETCKDARQLSWNTVAVQNPSYSAWWRVSLKPIKDVTAIDGYDAKVTLTNTGSKTVNLKVGQSLDCPSSGTTKRTFVLAPGQSVIDTIPRSMINSVQPDELYFGIENVESQVSILVEKVAQPSTAVIPEGDDIADAGITEEKNLRVTDTLVIAAGKTLYRIKVSDMDSLAKYEPEYTYRNEGTETAHVTIKMAFERPAYGTSNTDYVLAPGEEEIVVYKKNMLEGMEETVDSIYLLVITDQPINLYGRFKHIREGKACKTNIDYNWETGHSQEARTTQWYAINVADARDRMKDIVVYLVNNANASASIKASMAFSCPYIDLQELTHSVAARDTVSRRLGYSTYAMMSDTVWIGLETNQDIRFWADTVDAKKKAEADSTCLNAIEFNWEEGQVQHAGDTVWYKVNVDSARALANRLKAKFPTIYVQNLSTTSAVTIKGELSLECPDTIENQTRSLTIEKNGTYSKAISRTLFENIVQEEIYLRVITTEDVSIQIRLTEEAEGTSCASAIPFNWQSGNTQAANANLWYVVDLRNIMQQGNDLKLHLQNRESKECKGVIQLSYTCPIGDAPSIQDFKLGANAIKNVTIQNSALDVVDDSVVYVNLQGTTSLRFWADTLAVVPFDTIKADGITLVPLHWDSLYTQTEDTVWYIIPTSEIDLIRNMDEKVTPVAHLYNLGAAQTIKAEAAFAFPISKKMMQKSQELKANQHIKDTIPFGTFEQIMKKDSVILRVVRKKGGADFQFKAELVKAFNGNSRRDAIPAVLGSLYGQPANSEMWYRIRTADWKKKDLFGKRLFIKTQNVGTHTAEIKVEAYDGLMSEEDLLQGRANQKAPKGETRQKGVPAEAIYGFGDVELYLKVKTTDTLMFQTTFEDYNPIAPDPTQQDAKLLVPNVEYTLPGDNENHWYQICLPYMQNNYRYTAEASVTYTFNGKTTIEGTSTFQDTMKFNLPVRKRTVDRTGTHTVPLRELIEKGIKRAGYNFSFEETQPSFIDSILHRFVTKDSITLYIRLKSDKDVKVCLNMEQTKGVDNDCLNAMSFDWEHGNVNPKDQHTWYKATLDSTRIPEDKDLRLHIDNWGEESGSASASLYFKCDESAQGSVSRSIAPGDSIVRDIARDFIKNSGWPSMMFIDFNSTQAMHIWIELIDKTPRDTVRDTIPLFVCLGTDTLGHTINADMMWSDTIVDLNDNIHTAVYDSISYVFAYVLRDPKLYKIEEIDADSMPVVKRGEAIDVTLADQWLRNHYIADKTDTIKAFTNLTWMYSEDGASYSALNTSKLASARINLKYTLTLECDDELSDVYKFSARDTLVKDDACNSFKWEDSLYTASTFDSVVYPGGALLGDSIAYLKLTIENPLYGSLDMVAKYGDRLLMINRIQINKLLGKDSLDLGADTALVSWYREATPTDEFIGHGYYYTDNDRIRQGLAIKPGVYYAVIDVPSATGSPCGIKGETKHYTVSGMSAAPALMPSLAKPGEDIQIVNLDPDQNTIVRIYTTDGLLQHSFTTTGQTSYTIKAADAHGFYMVVLSNDSLKTTLRYIVK